MRHICRFIIFIAGDADQDAQCEDLRATKVIGLGGGGAHTARAKLAVADWRSALALDRRLEGFFLRAGPAVRLRESTFLNMVFS
eukprot:4192543-Prymnesium_polylepis.1